MEIATAIALVLEILRTAGPAAQKFITAINNEITDEEKAAAINAQDEAVAGLKEALE